MSWEWTPAKDWLLVMDLARTRRVGRADRDMVDTDLEGLPVHTKQTGRRKGLMRWHVHKSVRFFFLLHFISNVMREHEARSLEIKKWGDGD